MAPPALDADVWDVLLAALKESGEVSDVNGYDAILAKCEAMGVIPPKCNRKVQAIIDGHLFALRNLVERCVSKLKHRRRLAY